MVSFNTPNIVNNGGVVVSTSQVNKHVILAAGFSLDEKKVVLLKNKHLVLFSDTSEQCFTLLFHKQSFVLWLVLNFLRNVLLLRSVSLKLLKQCLDKLCMCLMLDLLLQTI